jgi:hypothetical protein
MQAQGRLKSKFLAGNHQAAVACRALRGKALAQGFAHVDAYPSTQD